MQMLFAFLSVLATVALVVAQNTYPEPPATFEASKYTKWDLRKVGESRRGEIDVEFTAADGTPDFVRMIRLDLVGDSKTRGIAHGALLAKEIAMFAGPELDKFVVQSIMNESFDKVSLVDEKKMLHFVLDPFSLLSCSAH